MSELVKGRASCHKTLLLIKKMAVLPKVRYALCAAREGPTDVEDAPAPAC